MFASLKEVELGSVQSGEVKLNWAPNLQLAYTGISNFGDIELKQRGLSDVSGFNSGFIQVQGRSIDISDGSVLLAQNFGFLPSGSINVNATDSLRLNSATSDTLIRSGITTQNFASGQGGDVNVTTKQLSLTSGASITTRTFSTAESGGLSASTASGQGGNLNLQLKDLQMRCGSYITTSAGNNGSGGNININTDTLIAFENSDITANSQDSMGGRVSINSQAIFGTEFRSLFTPQSDITATSGLGAYANGIVNINTIAANSNFALVELPETVAESNNQISNSCTVFARNKFVVMGNGGLPSSPDDLLIQPTGMIEPLDLISSQTSSSTNITPRREIVEAQRLIVDKGEVYLLAQAPGNIPNIPKLICNG